MIGDFSFYPPMILGFYGNPRILMVRRILGWYINLAIKDSEMFTVDL